MCIRDSVRRACVQRRLLRASPLLRSRAAGCLRGPAGLVQRRRPGAGVQTVGPAGDGSQPQPGGPGLLRSGGHRGRPGAGGREYSGSEVPPVGRHAPAGAGADPQAEQA
eukprot:10547990-Alexandrium_andersonii.AAC.1